MDKVIEDLTKVLKMIRSLQCIIHNLYIQLLSSKVIFSNQESFSVLEKELFPHVPSQTSM